jgi:hypothetical protein
MLLGAVVELAAVAQRLPGLAEVGPVGPAALVDVGDRAVGAELGRRPQRERRHPVPVGGGEGLHRAAGQPQRLPAVGVQDLVGGVDRLVAGVVGVAAGLVDTVAGAVGQHGGRRLVAHPGRVGADGGVGRVVAEAGHEGVEGAAAGREQVDQGPVGGMADGRVLVGQGVLGGRPAQGGAKAGADRLGVVGRPRLIDAGVDHGQGPGGDRRRRPGVPDGLQGRLVPDQDDVVAPGGDPAASGGGHWRSSGHDGGQGEQRHQPGGGRPPGKPEVAHRGLLG